MINVLVSHKIADYQRWRATFDDAFTFRQQEGEESCKVFQNAEDPHKITLLFEWQSAEKARQFMSSPDLQARMQKAGVVSPPDIVFLTELHTLRKSAAD
jgi:quinol monooxygenase YgiN